MRANYSPSIFREDILNEQDGICGCKPEHNGKPLVFIVDHIDGKASNNRRDNAFALTAILSWILINLKIVIEYIIERIIGKVNSIQTGY